MDEKTSHLAHTSATGNSSSLTLFENRSTSEFSIDSQLHEKIVTVDDCHNKYPPIDNGDTQTDNEDESHTPQEALPTKLGGHIYRVLRWNFFSVYRRLFTIVFLSNMIVLIVLLAKPGSGLTYSNTITAAAVNLTLSILTRQEHVVNVLFLLSSALTPRAPLLLRRWMAKIYSYGGLHSGCGVASLIWYLGFAGLVSRHLAVEPIINTGVAALTYIILSLLLCIAIFAHPHLRARLHDYFEATHRFAGWTAVALFWAQVVLTACLDQKVTGTTSGGSAGHALITTPAFWCLIIITLCIIYPWSRLRLRTLEAEPLSNHAIRLHFDYTTLDYCMGVRLSDNPLKETHAFASIPNRDGAKGFSVVISNAGDWTSKIIRNPPTKMYIRGAPTYGVLRVAVMFSPVVVVATGSGIGPCLSLFHGRPDIKARILWSTPNPLSTYGQGIVDSVLRADPHAVIIDTKKSGKRPDLVRLTYALWKAAAAEAVVVISNPKVTRKVVYGMETRGVPAYGPIFDS